MKKTQEDYNYSCSIPINDLEPDIDIWKEAVKAWINNKQVHPTMPNVMDVTRDVVRGGKNEREIQ